MTPVVTAGHEKQLAHDALLAMKPAGVVHERCDLCTDKTSEVEVKEVAQVADADRTYTEAEHLALMADAVTRETASVTDAKESAETKVTELTGRVDVLESEKATLQSEKDAAVKGLEDYKAEIERAKEIESAKADRKAKVKAANEALADDYFTDERVQRWAEMTEEAFTAFVEDITPVAPGSPAKETAAFSGGESPSEPSKPTAGSLFRHLRGETQN